MSVDLIVKNAKVYTSSGPVQAGLAVKDEKIVAICDEKYLPAEGKIIDASGKVVIPGLWFTHCHFRDPGFPQKEDFESGTKCAAAGGISFIIDMPNNDPAPMNVENFELKKDIARRKAVVDYGLYGGGVEPDNIQGLVEAGAIGIKIFNTRHVKDAYPYIPSIGITDHGILYKIFEATAKTGLVCAIHTDDSDWVRHMVHRDYIDKGRIDVEAYFDAWDKGYMYGHGHYLGFLNALYLAKLAGVRLYVLHLGQLLTRAYDDIRRAKREGQVVYAEAEAKTILYGREESLAWAPRTTGHAPQADEGFRAIKDGTTDVLVLEHAPHNVEELMKGKEDMFSCPLGNLGAQEFLPMMLTTVNQGKITLEQLIKVTSENPARIFGHYPQKGAIKIGSDADLTIIDMNRKGVFKVEDSYSRTGWTHEGREYWGAPTHTIIRGNIVMEEGKVLANPGDGKFHSGRPVEVEMDRSQVLGNFNRCLHK